MNNLRGCAVCFLSGLRAWQAFLSLIATTWGLPYRLRLSQRRLQQCHTEVWAVLGAELCVWELAFHFTAQMAAHKIPGISVHIPGLDKSYIHEFVLWPTNLLNVVVLMHSSVAPICNSTKYMFGFICAFKCSYRRDCLCKDKTTAGLLMLQPIRQDLYYSYKLQIN